MSLQEHSGSVGRIELQLNFPRAESDRGLLPGASFGDIHLDLQVQNPHSCILKPGQDQRNYLISANVNFVD